MSLLLIFLIIIGVSGVNVSCESGVMHAHGPVVCVSDHQREQVDEILKTNDLSCYAAREQQVHGGTHHTHIQQLTYTSPTKIKSNKTVCVCVCVQRGRLSGCRWGSCS